MEQIILSGLTIEQLRQMIVDTFKEVHSLQTELKKVPIQTIKVSGNFLTRKEVAKLLKISLPTLNEWTKEGLLSSYRIGSRVLYKFDEVEQAIAQRNFTKFSRAPNKL